MTPIPQVKQLPNGLRYVVAPLPEMKSATVLALVKAGTRYERPENNGISHFLEHMVFKGTANYPTALDITTEVDNVGGSFNAFTDKEYTGYYVKAAVTHLDLAMNVVSQLVFHPTLPAQELEVERGVILEEIRMYADEPQARVAQIFEKVMFGSTTLGWDTLGTEEVIRSLQRDAFEEYHNYLYVPNRMVVVIAGGVNEAETDEKMQNFFGKEKPLTQFTSPTYSFNQRKPKRQIVSKNTEQCHLIYGYRTFGRGNKDRYVISVLATILGGGMSSRLFNEIRDKRGLAYYVSSMVDMYLESGYLAVRAGTKPESAQEVISVSQAEFDKLRQVKVSDKELNKAKEYIKGHLMLGLENTYEVADFYAEDLLFEDKPRNIDEVLNGISAVTAEDIQRLSNSLFVSECQNLAAIGPRKIVSKLTMGSQEAEKAVEELPSDE